MREKNINFEIIWYHFDSSPDEENVAELLTVTLGLHNRSQQHPEEVQTIYVRRIEIHKNFHLTTLNADIAILYLTYPARITKSVDTISVATETPADGEDCYIGAYPSAESNFTVSRVERVSYVSWQICQIKMFPIVSSQIRVNETMCCAGYSEAICKVITQKLNWFIRMPSIPFDYAECEKRKSFGL